MPGSLWPGPSCRKLDGRPEKVEICAVWQVIIMEIPWI